MSGSAPTVVAATVLASSGTVLANLAYLIGAVVVAVIGGLLVWLRHRQPKSVDANMASFRRGLTALAPDPKSPPRASIRRSDNARLRPAPVGLTHVRLESTTPAGAPAPGPAKTPTTAPAGAVGAGDYDDVDEGGRPG